MSLNKQPCGNASIKRWAKCGALSQYPSLPPRSFPRDAPSHPKFFAAARDEGQIAPLCKRDKAIVNPESKTVVPAGLCTVDSNEGYIMR